MLFGYDPRGIRVRRDDSAGAHLFHLEGDRLEAVYDATGEIARAGNAIRADPSSWEFLSELVRR